MTTTTQDRTPTRGRAVNVTLWVLQVLMAAAFGMAAATKFTRYPAAVEAFDRIGLGDWFLYLVGSLELAGAVGLLIPILSGAAGLGLTGLLVGAALTQLLLFEPITVLTPLAYLVPIVAIAWGRRHQTTRLVRLVTTRKAAG